MSCHYRNQGTTVMSGDHLGRRLSLSLPTGLCLDLLCILCGAIEDMCPNDLENGSVHM